MINHVILVGNMTRDAEGIPSARRPMSRLRIATNNVWRDSEGNRQESTEYHSVMTFGRLAEIASMYCVRGRRVYVEGRLRTREYDGSDGLRRTATEIVAEKLKMLDRRDPTSPMDEAETSGE